MKEANSTAAAPKVTALCLSWQPVNIRNNSIKSSYKNRRINYDQMGIIKYTLLIYWLYIFIGNPAILLYLIEHIRTTMFIDKFQNKTLLFDTEAKLPKDFYHSYDAELVIEEYDDGVMEGKPIVREEVYIHFTAKKDAKMKEQQE